MSTRLFRRESSFLRVEGTLVSRKVVVDENVHGGRVWRRKRIIKIGNLNPDQVGHISTSNSVRARFPLSRWYRAFFLDTLYRRGLETHSFIVGTTRGTRAHSRLKCTLSLGVACFSGYTLRVRTPTRMRCTGTRSAHARRRTMRGAVSGPGTRRGGEWSPQRRSGVRMGRRATSGRPTTESCHG